MKNRLFHNEAGGFYVMIQNLLISVTSHSGLGTTLCQLP